MVGMAATQKGPLMLLPKTDAVYIDPIPTLGEPYRHPWAAEPATTVLVPVRSRPHLVPVGDDPRDDVSGFAVPVSPPTAATVQHGEVSTVGDGARLEGTGGTTAVDPADSRELRCAAVQALHERGRRAERGFR